MLWSPLPSVCSARPIPARRSYTNDMPVRNGLAAVVVFALTPWINSLGLYNTFVCASVLAWAVYLLTLPMLIWGRKWRVLTAASYRQHLARSGKHAPGTTAS